MYSDRPPAFVFPDTTAGRDRLKAFVAEVPDDLLGTCATCDRYTPMTSPVYTDDDLWRNRSVTPCGNRSRMGVRDMNWCCRCDAGFPQVWLTERDKDRLSDFNTLSGF